MMIPKRIRIEVYPNNPERRRYHVNTRIWPTSFTVNVDTVVNLVDDFHAIDGITDANLNTYDISVIRSPAFEWEELEPVIIDTIKAVVGWQDDDVEISMLVDGKVVTREEYQNELAQQRDARERERAFHDVLVDETRLRACAFLDDLVDETRERLTD